VKFLKLPMMQDKKTSREDGATVVEYAILAPVFFLIIFGIIEMSMIFFVEATLELAAQQSSRFARTGDTVTGQTRAATAKALVDQYTFGLLDTSKLTFTVAPYSNFAAIPNTLPTDGSQNFGGTGQVVVYTLSYDWPLFTGMVGQAMGLNGSTIKLTGSEITVNEPGL